MAVRLDDKLLGDIAGLAVLVEECGLADEDHAIGKLARIYDVCTKTQHYTVGLAIVRACLGSNGVDALVYAGFGELVDAHLPTRWSKRDQAVRPGEQVMRIRGTEGRIEWYGANGASAQAGGHAAQAKRKQGDESPARGQADGTAQRQAQVPADPPAEVQRSYLSLTSSEIPEKKISAEYEDLCLEGGLGGEASPSPSPGKPKRKASQASRLPDDWEPTAKDNATAAPGVNIDRELATFRDWATGNGVTKADWNATWRNWLRRATPGRASPRGPQYQADPTAIAYEELERIRAEERRRNP
jgi:hypothetical protein